MRQFENPMRIATYNVNGINGRLANLLGWLEQAAPDIVCLQELKAPDENSLLRRCVRRGTTPSGTGKELERCGDPGPRRRAGGDPPRLPADLQQLVFV